VIALLPVEEGADHESATALSSTVAARFVGTPGTPAGVTELLVPETVLVPTALVAVTVKVYAVPLFNPVTTAVVPVETTEILLFDVTV
jgi:hypothetical protein